MQWFKHLNDLPVVFRKGVFPKGVFHKGVLSKGVLRKEVLQGLRRNLFTEKFKGVVQLAFIALLLLSLSTAAQAAWIGAKATLAQHLLHKAWQQTLQTGEPVKPWPWADTVPIARLSMLDSGESMIVLDSAHGQAMAFGPAKVNYLDPSLQPTRQGVKSSDATEYFDSVIAIAGHRDTHMAFLEHAQSGSRFELQNVKGERKRYRMTKKQVVNSVVDSLAIDSQQSGLVLITCFPFNATQTGGPLRMVASAVLDSPPVSGDESETGAAIGNTADTQSHQ